MYGIKINVSGPGGTFGEIPFLVRQCLENAGATVTVCDELPPNEMSEKEATERIQKFHSKPIQMTVEHLPWGG